MPPREEIRSWPPADARDLLHLRPSGTALSADTPSRWCRAIAAYPGPDSTANCAIPRVLVLDGVAVVDRGPAGALKGVEELDPVAFGQVDGQRDRCRASARASGATRVTSSVGRSPTVWAPAPMLAATTAPAPICTERKVPSSGPSVAERVEGEEVCHGEQRTDRGDEADGGGGAPPRGRRHHPRRAEHHEQGTEPPGGAQGPVLVAGMAGQGLARHRQGSAGAEQESRGACAEAPFPDGEGREERHCSVLDCRGGGTHGSGRADRIAQSAACGRHDRSRTSTPHRRAPPRDRSSSRSRDYPDPRGANSPRHKATTSAVASTTATPSTICWTPTTVAAGAARRTLTRWTVAKRAIAPATQQPDIDGDRSHRQQPTGGLGRVAA